eukprot:TRINITY_DN35374_c0_g1_i1.p1 TRINITY_DN35374_c0_g1~~TRINITY_DN35374_c0_g1_i1.p1  ORF type:complete len:680 (-),score=118.78 TRINITY_DN35374_c0_g1_i1:2217-4256(-)
MGEGTDLQLTANADDGMAGEQTFQWYKDGNIITDATKTVLDLNNLTVADAGEYFWVSTNMCGTDTTETATITIDLKPTIETQPLGGIGCRKNDYTFTVVADGFEPLAYQWYKDGHEIQNADESSFTLTNLEPGNAASYYVVVSNSCGSVSSNEATLAVTFDTKPEILIQPIAVESCEGNFESFNIMATGSENLSYQWYFNGNAIDGANAATYSIESINIDNQGDYSCVISNTCGITSSLAATLTVDLSPVFTQQPVNAVKCLNGQYTVSVAVTGKTPFKYKWYKNAVGISGATNATYTINNLTLANQGDYTCVVTNDCNTVISDASTLTVVSPITVAQQPADADVCVGSEASFSVQVNGDNPVYQWYFGDVPIQGANESTYTIPSVSAQDAGGYICLINGCNTVFSHVAILTVGTAPAISVQPVNALTCPGIEHLFSLTATGKDLTYQWYNDNGMIEGAVSASYSTALEGTYYCVVKGTCGEEVQSNEVTLGFNENAVIEVQPVSGATCPEEPYTFSVTAQGSGLTYQWYNSNGIIEDAISSEYSTSTEGLYFCVVSGSCGSPVQSEAASLTVKSKPSITLQPVGDTKCIDNDFTLTLDASGTAPLQIYWYHDGIQIPESFGKTTYTFTIDDVLAAGNYYASVSNTCGATFTEQVALVVNTPPSFIPCTLVSTQSTWDK